MSLKRTLEAIERHLDGGKSHSRKWMKKMRNKWLRRTKIDEIPNTKLRKGWEY